MVNRACFEHYSGRSKQVLPSWASQHKSSAFVGWQRFVSVALLVLGCVLISGCGGDDEEAVKVTTPVQPPVSDDGTTPDPDGTDPDGTDDAETNPDGTPKGEDEKEEEPEEKKEPEKPEEPPRPEMVEKWKANDYLSAKVEGDRRLQEAVIYMADNFSGNPQVAELFKKLLVVDKKPGKELPDGTPGRPIETRVSLTIADALIKGLGKNKTPAAMEVLKEIMLGKIETPVEGRRGLNSVLDALIVNMDYQPYEDYLFELITNPEKATGGATINPEDPIPLSRFQSMLVNAMQQTASTALCNRLAKHLDDPQVSQELARELEALLVPDRPETLQAKLILYQNKRTERRTKGIVERVLATHSENALKILLGVPPKLEVLPEPGILSRPSRRQEGYTPEEIALEMKFAQLCWTPDFIAYLNEQLKKADTLDSIPGVVQLLTSMPTDYGRFSESEMFSYHAYRGPKFLTAARLMGQIPTDPAIVVLAKQVYHGSPRRVTRVDKDDMRPAVDQAAKEQWESSSDSLVQGWIQKMYSAAQNSDSMEQAALRDKGNFRVNLHPDARVVAEYHLVWPAGVQAMLPDMSVAPVEIHYIRIEEEAALPEKMESYYKRYGGGISSPKHDVRNGFWFDDLANGSTPRSKVSVDIRMVHKPILEDPKAVGINEPKPIPLSIDILTIEVPEITPPEGYSTE